MSTLYTENDLIRYLYRETTVKESSEIREAIRNNYYFQELMASLKLGKLILNEATYEPSESSLKIILSHGKSTEEHLEPMC